MNLNRLALAIMAATFASSSAHAAYYVEEDIPPAVTQTLAVMSPPPAATATKGTPLTTFSVPFRARKNHLYKIARDAIDYILPSLSTAQNIVIQGRPDPSNPTNIDLAHRRAIAIQRYLRKKGIQKPIKIEVVREAEYGDESNIYNSTILLPAVAPQQQQPQPQPTYATHYATQQSQPAQQSQPRVAYYPPTPQAPTPPPQPAADNIKRLLKIAQDAGLSAEDTLALITSSLQGNGRVTLPEPTPPTTSPSTHNAPNPARQTAGNTQYPISYTPPAMPTPPAQPAMQPNTSPPPDGTPSQQLAISIITPPTQWSLETRRTLRDNLETWAKTAGWKPLNWAAENYYEVAYNVTVNGNFPDVLRQVAEATGLNICARKSTRTIKVTEGNVSCRD